jgi:gliding motility-associated-like protein
VTVDLYGSYVFQWTEVNGNCSQSDQVTIDFNENPDGLSAGADDIAVCDALSYTLTGTGHTYQALSEHNGSTRIWSYVSGPDATPTFADPTDPHSLVTVDLYGSYVFQWTEVNGNCSQSDQVTIDFNENPDGLSAGADQNLCGVLTTTLTGTSHTYQAGSDHAGSTRQWSQVSGIGTITFDDATDPATDITADLYGSYVLRWTETNGTCTRTDDVTIWFDPTPVITANSDTICNNELTAILPQTSTINALYGVRYTWTTEDVDNIINGETPSVGNGYQIGRAIRQQLNNPDNAPHKVIYHITPWTIYGDSTLHCFGSTIDIDIWVEPTPQLFPVPANTIQCDSTTTNILLQSPSTFTSGVIKFKFTATAPVGLTGYTASATNLPNGYIIADNLINSTDDPLTVSYTIVPVSPTGCNDGPGKTVTVTVNPTPRIFPVPVSSIQCDSTMTNIRLQSPSIFTSGVVTFNYTAVATGATGDITGFTAAASGLANNYIIAQTLINHTDVPQAVTYTITPVSGVLCNNGPSKTVTVTVNPTPKIFPVSANTIQCDSTTTNILLQSPSTFTSGLVTFKYTVTATGGVTGFTTPVSGLPNNHIITDKLINPTDAPQTVTYAIVPVSPTGCNDGPGKVITVTVNPTPRIFPVPPNTIQCDSTTTNILLQSPSTFTSGVIKFKFTATAPVGLTGYTASSTNLPNGFIIADNLINSTDGPLIVSYAIVPVSPTGCNDGPGKVITVTVNPTPRIFPVPANTIQCDSTTTNILLQSPSTFTSGIITFKYTVTATGGVTGFTTPVSSKPNNFVIADKLINPTDAPQTVTYTIIPVSPTGCNDGPGKTVIVTVNPTPRIYPIPANTIQCDSTTTNIQLQSPSTFTSGLITFKYTASATGTVTGFDASEINLPDNFVIADNLINLTDIFQVVTYVVIPVSPTGCVDGPAKSITVTVNPTPKVVPVIAADRICFGGSVNITLTSPTVMTSGGIRFDYTVGVSSGSVIGNTNPGNDLSAGYHIIYSYQNNSDTIQSVYYSILPYNNAICVPGNTVKSEVKIHAKPLQSLIITQPLTCETGPGTAALSAIISKGADPYHIVWEGSFDFYEEDVTDITGLPGGWYHVKVTDNLNCAWEDEKYIFPESAIPYIYSNTIVGGVAKVTCPYSSDGMIKYGVSYGSTAPYSYWVIRNNQDTIDTGTFPDKLIYSYKYNQPPGIYTLKIKDFNGCENASSFEINAPEETSVTFGTSIFEGGFNVSCNGYNDGSVWVQTISGSNGGPYTYQWSTTDGSFSGPGNTNRLDGITAGKYFLTTRDILGCTKIDSIVITEPDGIQMTGYTLSATNDGNFNISCYGKNDGAISLVLTGGSGIYNYEWTGPAGANLNNSSGRSQTGLIAGVYDVKVIDHNGCFKNYSFTLTQPDSLSIAVAKSLTSDGAYNIACNGGTGIIGITVSGGSVGNYSFNWTSANGSGIISGQEDQYNLTAGSYNVIVNDINGCSLNRDISLMQPQPLNITLAPTNITCEAPGLDNGSVNLSVSGGRSPYQFIWSNGRTTEDINNLTTGYYKVNVTDTYGCMVTDSVAVLLPPPLTLNKSISSFNSFGVSCYGMSDGMIRISPTNGDSPFIFNWNGPDGFVSTDSILTGLKAGRYVVQMTDKNYCKISDTTILTQPNKLGMAVTLSSGNTGGFNINCAGDKTGTIDINALNSVGTVRYIWSDGATGRSRYSLSAGNFGVILTDKNNCQIDSTITLTQPDSIITSVEIVKPFCSDLPDGQIRLTVTGGVITTGYSFKWSDNSLIKDRVDVTKGTYIVSVKDDNSCEVIDTVIVETENESCLMIPNIFSPNGDFINDVWNIGMIYLYPGIEVTIFNRWGETVWKSEKGYPTPWDGRSNGVILPVDSYHYIINLHNGSKVILGNVTIVK